MWRFSDTADKFRQTVSQALHNLSPSGMADDNLLFRGQALFLYLFPKKATSFDGEMVYDEVLAFFRPQLQKARDAAYYVPPTIFVRMIQTGPSPCEPVPLGLLAVKLDESPSITRENGRFLGEYVLIEAPLEVQSYKPSTGYLSRWVMVLPPDDIRDNPLADQQRVGRVYRGAIQYRDGKPYVDAARLARWFWKGLDENPESAEWYPNSSNLIAELTAGSRTTFRNAVGEIIETVDDYELLTDLMADQSLGTRVTTNFAEAWEIYTRFKTGRIRMERSDFEGWVPEGEKLPSVVVDKISSEPLRRYLDEQGIAISSFSENDARSVNRYLAKGEISLDAADKLAVKLGVHPSRIWGDEFYDSLRRKGKVMYRAFDENDRPLKLFSGGNVSQQKAALAYQILHGHLIRHWENEIATGRVRDLPLDDVLQRFEHRGPKGTRK